MVFFIFSSFFAFLISVLFVTPVSFLSGAYHAPVFVQGLDALNFEERPVYIKKMPTREVR